MKHSNFSVIFMRVGIVALWATVIILFLHAPSLAMKWRDPRSISIMTWSELIDDQIIRDFQKETGIKVYVSYTASNEELYAKIKATGGEGYDLIMPSDYTVSLLRKDNLLKKLDQSKLTIGDRLDRRYMNAFYDPDSEYSLPYFIQIYGIGIDKDFFKDGLPHQDWGLLFDVNTIDYNIVMLDTPRENVLLTSHYLFNSIEGLTNEQLQQIQRLLIEQKKWVTAYTEMRADYLLLTRACPVITSTTTLIWKMINEYDFVDFIVPRNGSFVTVDNIVIPKNSTHDDLVYEFINYLYRPEVLEHHFLTYRFFAATTDLIDLMDRYNVPENIKQVHSDATYPLFYFRNVIPEKIINDIWISLKAY